MLQTKSYSGEIENGIREAVEFFSDATKTTFAILSLAAFAAAARLGELSTDAPVSETVTEWQSDGGLEIYHEPDFPEVGYLDPPGSAMQAETVQDADGNTVYVITDAEYHPAEPEQ